MFPSKFFTYFVLLPIFSLASIQPLNDTQTRTYFGQYFTKLSGKSLTVVLPISSADPNLSSQNPLSQTFPIVTENEPAANSVPFAHPVVPPQSVPSTDPAAQSSLPPIEPEAQPVPLLSYPTISPDAVEFPSFGPVKEPNATPLPFSTDRPPLISINLASPTLKLPTVIGNQLPSQLAQSFPITIPLPTNNAGTAQCGCVAAGTCISLRGGNGDVINLRIVTQNPGITCPTGQQYCCTQDTNQAQTESCGLQNIVPGVTPTSTQANLGEFPWSGIIFDSAGQFVGGAALIDQYHLLTAAHLVSTRGNGAGLKVRLGEWDVSGTYEPVAFAEYNVAGIVIHPSFVASTLQHDLAIIRLAAPATLLTAPTPQVNTVCLPTAADVFTGAGCFVAGWGRDSFNGNYQNIIKKVDVPIIGNDDCQARLRTTKLGPNYALDTTSFICAGGELAKDACQGDGGNALVCARNNRYFVAGITAGGVNCGQQGIPGLYVRTTSYLAWIAQQTAGVPTTPIGTIDPRRGRK